MYRSDVSGVGNGNTATTGFAKATNQPWNQTYHLAVSQQRPNRLILGLQDNGSNKSWERRRRPGPDGPGAAQLGRCGRRRRSLQRVRPDRRQHLLHVLAVLGRRLAQLLAPHRQRDGDDDRKRRAVQRHRQAPNNRYTTDAPIVTDPNIPPKDADGTQPPNALYIGRRDHRALAEPRHVVHARSRRRPLPQSNYTDPDPSLPGHVPADEVDTGLYSNLYGAVTYLAPAKSATPVPYAQVIYAGTDTGKVWKTADAGATWVQMQGLPTRWVNRIIADPDDANHAYIAFSGFRQGDDAANVWETRDGGTSWQNISSNMPNGPVEMIEYDPMGNVLFAATDVGVFDHKDGDGYWYKISVGLPQVPMIDVKLSGDRKTLYVATFGRSTFKLNLSTDATDGGGAAAARAARCRRRWRSRSARRATFGPFQPGRRQGRTRVDDGERDLDRRRRDAERLGPVLSDQRVRSRCPEPVQVAFCEVVVDGARGQRPGDDLVQAAHRRQHRRCAPAATRRR